MTGGFVALLTALLLGLQTHLLYKQNLSILEQNSSFITQLEQTDEQFRRSRRVELIRSLYDTMQDHSGRLVPKADVRTRSEAVPEFLEIERFRLKGSDERVSLNGVLLQNTDLAGLDLSNIDFRGTNLHAARLENTNLTGAKMFGTNLSNAALCESDFEGATLWDADLRGARLVGASLGPGYCGPAKITDRELERACGDANTILPKSIKYLQKCKENQSTNMALPNLNRPLQ